MSLINKSYLLIAILIVPALASRAQTNYYFRHYEVEHGLSNNIVLCSLQDKKGFMWFGTIDGLNRFDAHNFKTYRHNPADPFSIGNNSVYTIIEDENEFLWLATNRGMYIFNPADQKFRLISFTRNLKTRSLFLDKYGEIWLTIEKKVARYNPGTNNYLVYDSGLEEVSSICGDEEGNVWLATTNGLLKRYNRQANTFTSYDLFQRSPPGSTRNIEEIFNTQRGFILVGTVKEGLKKFDIAKGTYEDIKIYNADRTEIIAKNFMRYSENEYWIATESGIIIYDISTGTSKALSREYNNDYSISDNVINTLCKDNEGGIWAGSRFGGINYHAYPFNHFTKYFSRDGANSIGGNGIHEIYPDTKGNIWIGTEDGGLNKFNPRTTTFRHFLPDGKKGSISYSNIHGLLVAGDELWIGTYQYGLDRMDLKTEKVIKHYKAGVNSFKSNFIVHLFKTRDNEVLVGTWEGLYRYSSSGDNFSLVPGFDFQTQSIVEDKSGLLWICTLGNGLFSYNMKTGQARNYKNDPRDSNSLANNMVNGEFIDSTGIIWLATEGGLCRLDPSTNIFKTFTVADGLPSNFLFKILEDDQHNLWISSTRGLVRFNQDKKEFRTFTTANGLLNDQFNWNSAYKDSSGRMYFGSVKGMISFFPAHITENEIVPRVYITGIQVNNKDSLISLQSSQDKSATYIPKVNLTHKESTFSIDFAGLSYISPQMNEYSYKLDGFDKNWTSIRGKGKAFFTGLPAGKYKFRVKAANNSGIWNHNEAALDIVILPPVWASIWAYLIYMVVGGCAIGLTVTEYHKRVSEKHDRKIEQIAHEKENELYRHKMEFFTNIAHEIRTPLTLIKGPMEDILCHTASVPEIMAGLKIMERNTNRLLDIANQLLDFRHTEVTGFSLNMQENDVAELLADLHTSFEPLAFHHKLEFLLELPYKQFIARVDADSLQKIIGNLYTNAIKYAHSKVYVRFRELKDKGQFRIEFYNDGYLIPYELKDKIFEPFFRIRETNSQKGTGIGLAISKTLTELNKGTLNLEESTNNMNVFVLTFPYGNEEGNILSDHSIYTKSLVQSEAV